MLGCTLVQYAGVTKITLLPRPESVSLGGEAEFDAMSGTFSEEGLCGGGGVGLQAL
jgi:hypothetical protein